MKGLQKKICLFHYNNKAFNICTLLGFSKSMYFDADRTNQREGESTTNPKKRLPMAAYSAVPSTSGPTYSTGIKIEMEKMQKLFISARLTRAG